MNPRGNHCAAAPRTAWVGRAVTAVRVTIMVVALVTGGFGAVAYVLAWMLVPPDDRDGAILGAVRTDRRGLTLAAAAGVALAAVQATGSLSGAGWLGFLAWPLGLTAAGLLLVWRDASLGEQAVIRRLGGQLLGLREEHGRPQVLARACVAGVLAAGACSPWWHRGRAWRCCGRWAGWR